MYTYHILLGWRIPDYLIDIQTVSANGAWLLKSSYSLSLRSRNATFPRRDSLFGAAVNLPQQARASGQTNVVSLTGDEEG